MKRGPRCSIAYISIMKVSTTTPKAVSTPPVGLLRLRTSCTRPPRPRGNYEREPCLTMAIRSFPAGGCAQLRTHSLYNDRYTASAKGHTHRDAYAAAVAAAPSCSADGP